LSNLAGYADFSSVFDMYKIEAVSVEFTPQYTQSNGVTSSLFLPRLFTTIDHDEGGVPTSLGSLQQQGSCIVCPQGAGVIRTFMPRVAVDLYNGTFSGFGNLKPPWIDIGSPGVEHYACKYGTEAGVLSQSLLQQWSITVTAFVVFSSTR